jgi:hypothetical protein
MVYLQTNYELCFGEAYFEYIESCDFSRENTNIDVSVFMFDLRMINMSSECEYDWYWKILACSTEYEACDSPEQDRQIRLRSPMAEGKNLSFNYNYII